jgi:hypothetical protein
VLFNNKSKIKSFEKNPIKGGTPAIEKRSIVRLRVVNELKENSFREYNVLVFTATVFNTAQNSDINEILYKNI